ncbi:MAG: hybrid sensor histidine kinase/response regulator [Rhodocyclaceae bacterium]|nr:hybrid sensor histidine kinase/response regulator [Rhodocyclaceae bacterium]
MKRFSSLRGRVWLLAALVTGPLFFYSLLVYPGQGNSLYRPIGLVLLAVASLLLARLAMERLFLRWTERLHDNLRRLAAGEREIRLQPESPVSELREIDAALASMAANMKAGASALAVSREHLGLALDGAGLGAWEWQLGSGFRVCDGRLARMFGYDADDLVFDAGQWAETVHPDDWRVVEAALDRHFSGLATLYECEYRVRRRDGRWIWLLVHGRVVEWDGEGKPVRMAGTALDLTNHKATEQQLRQRTEELVALVEAMPAVVYIARDPECREVVGNRAANEFCGPGNAFHGSSGAGSVADIRYYRPDGEAYAENELPLQRAVAERQRVEGIQMEVRLPEGRNRWLLGNASPLFDDQGGVRGALAAFVDITQLKTAKDDLQRHRGHLESLVAERTYELAVAKEAAERANRTKSRFLANVSHQLRTPLNSLMVLAHVLVDNPSGNLTPQQIEYARLIQLSGSDLVNLIDELLDLTRIEAGRVNIQIRPVPFPDVMQNVRSTHRHVAKQKGLDFKMAIDADVPAAIVTDPERLQQLLRNLFSNAIKFTAQGEVALRIRRAVSGWRYGNPALADPESVIAFDVIDTGSGIDPVQQHRILEIFGQAPAGGKTERNEGSGLGLAISREIAALLGGELGLTSIHGQGSTFTLYLPLVYAGPVTAAGGREPKAAAPATASESVDSALGGKTVLVVDDDLRNRFVLGTLLERRGLQVLRAGGGAEALDILAQGAAVDAVLLDIRMPGMDGYEATRAIRENLGRTALPIIALTADVMTGSREACLAAGCSDYLTKPINHAELLACLCRWLERSPAEA